MLKLPPLLPEEYAELVIQQSVIDLALQGVPSGQNLLTNFMQQRSVQMNTHSNAQTTEQKQHH